MPELGSPRDSAVTIHDGDAKSAIVSLRTTRPEDEGFLLQIYASTRADEMALIDWKREQRDAFLRMQFDAQRWSYEANYPQADHQIILLNDQPIGRIWIARGEHEIILVDIALLLEHRGHGIGSNLLHELIDEAKQTHKPIRLHVFKGNRAMQLYTRLGFQVIAEQEPYIEMELQPHTTS
jgi:ribosomal protein S18 acetylase RimI-like enzyme